jgi:arginine deiminase
VGRAYGVDSETGRLRSVLVHRPGLELARITSRYCHQVFLDSPPWVARLQEEHDAFARILRQHGIDVLYVTELLQDALEYQAARTTAIESVVSSPALGDELRARVRGFLEDLSPEALSGVLISGLAPDELPAGAGVVFELLDRHDFVIDPLPNLVFARDSSFWIGDSVGVASLAAHGRRREAALMQIIYSHHPAFADTTCVYSPDQEHLEGSDVLLLAPGVVAIGVGSATTPAGAERLAGRLLGAGLADTVLAVPFASEARPACLDTLCTVVDADSVLMHPARAFSLTAHAITAARPPGRALRISRPQPFLEAAAHAMGIDRLRLIETGRQPALAPGQYGAGSGNVLVIEPGLVVCHERDEQTCTELETRGIQVIPVPAGELRGPRGGPRSLSCPVSRDPATPPATIAAPVSQPRDSRGYPDIRAYQARIPGQTAGTGPGLAVRRGVPAGPARSGQP